MITRSKPGSTPRPRPIPGAKTKSFSQPYYDKYDKEKHLAIEYFKKKNMRAWIPDDRYDVDLIVEGPDGNIFYCDVEVRQKWFGPVFPWAVVNVLYRKEKQLYLDKPTVMFFFNYERTHAVLLSSNVIKQYEPKETPNSEVPEGEYTYRVPKDKAYFIKV